MNHLISMWILCQKFNQVYFYSMTQSYLGFSSWFIFLICSPHLQSPFRHPLTCVQTKDFYCVYYAFKIITQSCANNYFCKTAEYDFKFSNSIFTHFVPVSRNAKEVLFAERPQPQMYGRLQSTWHEYDGKERNKGDNPSLRHTPRPGTVSRTLRV